MTTFLKFVAALSLGLSSCAFLRPSISIGLSRVSNNYVVNPFDTTKTIFTVDSKIDFDFDLSGSYRISIRHGHSRVLAKGVSPGWFYVDVIGASMWVRGLPLYLIGGDSVSIQVANNYLNVDGKTFFMAQQEKSTQFSYDPSLSISCVGCTRKPTLKFDDEEMNYVPPSISAAAGWHTIEIYSPFDNVDLYFRTLFDNYTITEFTLYPILMN
ncbi:MAG TPA: hypothetical protein VLX91_12000 [Candidatus Acidoferrales bacterium]|nr:hypothetical protein [Candidatus Acidoferrales bacterium]